jgi:hypothetical protein
MNLAKLATQTDGLKLLLVVHSREQLEGRSGLLPGGFPSCIYAHEDQPECLRQIQMKIFNSYVYYVRVEENAFDINDTSKSSS